MTYKGDGRRWEHTREKQEVENDTLLAPFTMRMTVYNSVSRPVEYRSPIAVAANADAVYNNIPKDSYLLSAR